MKERDIELHRQAGWSDSKLIDLVRADAMEAARAANESWALMCKKMVELEREALKAEDWTTIMREGSLVTWLDAEELGERVRAVIRARETHD